jgi:hypothetical protein
MQRQARGSRTHDAGQRLRRLIRNHFDTLHCGGGATSSR